MKPINVITNVSTALVLGGIGIEAGESAIRRGKKAASTAVAIKDIRNNSGDFTLNKASVKHNAMKDTVRNLDMFNSAHKALGALSGAGEGFVEGMKGNLLTSGLAISTLLINGKHTKIKTAAAVATGASAAWDFIKNGTNLFAKKDDIEKQL